MKVFVLLVALVASVSAQLIDESPKPYAFNYVAEGEEGSSSHQETSDGSGIVRGSYSLNDIDGRNRVVEYVAGPEGFSATIRTNEPGTDNLNPADVIVESSAEEARPATRPEVRSAAVEPRPVVRPIGSTAAETPRRYVLVPVTDPRARAYLS